MLNDKLKSKQRTWFKGSNMTIQEFLDYACSNDSDFIIIKKYKSDNLFEEPDIINYLSDRRCEMPLDKEECEYLSSKNEYFHSKI